jgi:hypothetical protein
MKKTLSSSGLLRSKKILNVSSTVLLLFFILTNLGLGQTTFSWNFGTTSGNAAPSSGTLANLTVGSVTIGNTLGTVTTYITNASASSGYTGASGTYNAGNACRIGALNTATGGSAYFEFILTPASGYSVNLSSISFGTRSTSTAPQAFTVRSSLDNFVSDIATGTITNNSTWSLKTPTTTSTTGPVGTAVTFRIYGYNGTGSPGSGTINWKIDDLSIVVSVSSPGTPNISVTGALNPFTANIGTPSVSQTYTVSGLNLTDNITIVPPAQFEISKDNSGWITSSGSIVLTHSGGTVGSTTIYVRFNPTAAGSFSSNISHTSSGATSQNQPVSGVASAYYYYSGAGDVANTSNWGTDPGGTGYNPADFTTNNQVFYLVNTNDIQLSSDWSVSGSSSKVVLGNGADLVNLTIASINTLTGTIDLSANSTLILRNTTINHTYGLISPLSTINYDQSGTFVVPNIAYGNLTLTGGTKTFNPVTLTVLGNLTFDNVTLDAGSVNPFTTIMLKGNLIYTGMVTSPPTPNSFTLNCYNNGTQTISGNGNTVRLFRLQTSGTSTNVILDNASGGSYMLLGNTVSGGLILGNGTNLSVNSNTIEFLSGGKAYFGTGTGTLSCNSTSNLILNTSSTSTLGTIYFADGANTLNNLTINETSSGAFVLGSDLNILGSLTLTSGDFKLGSANLILGTSAVISGTPSSANLIDATGTGQFIKSFSGAGSFIYPVGNGGATPVYSPATLNFTSGTFSSATAGISITSTKYSNNNSTTDYLKRSWTVTQNGITGFSCNVSFRYDPVDVTGTEGNIYVGKYNGVWEILGPVDAVNHKLDAVGISGFSTFTGGELSAMPVNLVSFSASVQKQNVILNWSTSSETNNSGFEILRSQAGSETWNSIGFVKGSGTKNTITNYSFPDNNLPSGKFLYRLKQIDNNGNFNYHNLGTAVEVETPKKFELTQNYPNPFNPVTKIDYSIPFDAKVKMIVYDMLGREVLKPVNTEHKAGYYTIEINSSALSSGIYFYRLTADMNGNTQTLTKKMLMLK